MITGRPIRFWANKDQLFPLDETFFSGPLFLFSFLTLIGARSVIILQRTSPMTYWLAPAAAPDADRLLNLHQQEIISANGRPGGGIIWLVCFG
ncbi:hypothetical protein BO71DRAFT_182419 [Aspergillus ellipticus CBS 707.79]|uniref:Uncharacterized protein n=1 Tax=Aspergillus ellipticus CBS 707.79 TaxID=1448320 RepID=A0A319DFX3_9EURO|nr:hypothetical protein BO71DRAFT_182419 [Aspergillus ellipticus CBS 707.79]